MATGRNTLSSTTRSCQELLEFKQWKKGTKKDSYFEKKKQNTKNYEIFLNNNKAIAFLKRAPRPMGVSKGREESSFICFLLHKAAAAGPTHLWSNETFSRRWMQRKVTRSTSLSHMGWQLWECPAASSPSWKPLLANQRGERAEALRCCRTKCISEIDGLLQKLKTFFFLNK